MDSDTYYKAMRIRMVEREISKRYNDKNMRCPIHLSIGQELNAVALCEHLTGDDQMVSTHRGHAHYLAKGGSLEKFIAELHGKATGCSGGLGGSMHLCAPDVGFMGSTSIVGGTIPVGVGLAFANKLQGKNNLVVICMGDAAVEEGVFWESWNFAKLHSLKVLFYCEDNDFSCYTHISERQHEDFMYFVSDGCLHTPEKKALTSMVSHARSGNPTFVRLKTNRKVEHCGPDNDDHLGYKTKEYINDPDPLFDFQYSEEKLREFKLEIENAFRLASEAPFPKETVLFK
jgi:TPP-dependent pyruvate/acetoin dehydrogenase alpha subunit